MNLFIEINLKNDQRFKDLETYLSRLIKPFFNRKLLKNKFENFDDQELYRLKNLI